MARVPTLWTSTISPRSLRGSQKKMFFIDDYYCLSCLAVGDGAEAACAHSFGGNRATQTNIFDLSKRARAK